MSPRPRRQPRPSPRGGWTYRQAGVDIDAGEEAVRRIVPLARATRRPGVLGGIGAFAGFFDLARSGYRDPVLVSSTDGVGTKLKVAFLADRHDTVGIDLVAMGVNDLLVHGAEPLFFLDYLATSRVVPERVAAIVRGIAEGCRQAGCALLGGETAELPEFYAPGEYDLAGFAVGVVERGALLPRRGIRQGDALIGLASSGLHSNGYSLARKVLFDVMGLKVSDPLPECGRTVAEELLEPTRIYVKPVRKLLKAFSVKGMAHITGGGITGNLPRVLPEGCHAVVRRESWPVPAIFTLLHRVGKIADDEMFRTFNMGLGMILVVRPEDGESVRAHLVKMGMPAYRIGGIVRGPKGAQFV